MMSLPKAFALAFAQLSDRAVRRVLIKTVLATLALFVALAALLALVGAPLLADYTGRDSTTLAVIGVLLAAVAGFVLFRVVAIAVMQLFADEVVSAVEARHYPGIPTRSLGLARELRIGLKGALRAVLVNAVAAPFAIALLVTGVGTALLFWAVNAWLLGRELQDMVWLRQRHADEAGSPLSAGSRLALGGLVAALMLVPVVNLLAPVLGAAAATHLVHGARQRGRHA